MPDSDTPETTPEKTPEKQLDFLSKATEVTIRISLIALLAISCFAILKPFLLPVVWGVIIAAASFPAHHWLQERLGGRQGLAASLLAGLGVLVIVVPAVLSATSLVESAQWLTTGLSDGSLEVPPPPEEIASWPLIGEPLHGFWLLASGSLSQALAQVGPMLAPYASRIFGAAAGLGLSLLQSLISILIAGALLANSATGARTARAIASRLVQGRGEEFVELAAATVRGVTVGILGVAIIQALLIAVGLFAIGIPHASLWAVVCLMLAVVQLPPFLVVIPIMIYAFGEYGTTSATLFAIWTTLACLSDNVLKPILLARGLDIPMAVIFMGSIGGFMAAGFIGLFLGAVILALGYELLTAWIVGDEPREAEETP